MDVKRKETGIIAAMLLLCLTLQVRATPQLVVVSRDSRCQTSAWGGADDVDEIFTYDYDPDPFFWEGGAGSNDGPPNYHNGTGCDQESTVQPDGISFYGVGSCRNLAGYETSMEVEFTVTEAATGLVSMGSDFNTNGGATVNTFIELVDEADEEHPLFTDTFSTGEAEEGGSHSPYGNVSLVTGHTYRFRIWNIGLSVEGGEETCDMTGGVSISAP